MSSLARSAGCAMVAAGISLAGCGHNVSERGPSAAPPPGAEQPAPQVPERTARTLTIPGTEPAPDDPHAGIAERASALIWDVPAGWKEEPPSSSMRRSQYRVSGPAGDAECVVFYFGPGQGGDPAANAVRWANQFAQPDGRPATEVMRLVEVEGTRVPVHLVEVTGTYDGGMTMTDAPASKQPGWMLLGGIAQGADAPWFFKLTGPEATVRAEREAFLGLLRSVRAGPP